MTINKNFNFIEMLQFFPDEIPISGPRVVLNYSTASFATM